MRSFVEEAVVVVVLVVLLRRWPLFASLFLKVFFSLAVFVGETGGGGNNK